MCLHINVHERVSHLAYAGVSGTSNDKVVILLIEAQRRLRPCQFAKVKV